MKQATHGFTMVELIVVMVLIGILSAVAIPRLTGANMAGPAFRNELVAALRFAQKTAVSHRRVVCASLTPVNAATTITLSISQTAGTYNCGTSLALAEGSTSYTSRDPDFLASGNLVGTLYFQPTGTITADGAGTTIVSGTITVTGQTGIAVEGATGYVE